MRTYAMIAVGLSVGSAAIALVGDKARALATVAPPAPFEISGTVTDASGAPVRGAFVTVADEQSAISRLTDSNGAYRIVVPYPAEFSLSASRFGFATQSVTLTSKDNGTRSFQLSPEFDRTQLTSAQITSFLPKNTETDWLKARCVGCHGMTEPEQFRGSDEGVFDSILRNMQLSYGITFLHDPDLKYAAKLTTKYFGKDAPAPSLETVKSRPVDQEALKATIFTINLRNTDRRGLPHSIVADRKGGAWIAVPGNNEITHWDFESGKLSSVAMPKPVSMPHTPTLDRTGRVWTGMPGARQMSVITPGTNDVRYVDLESVPHTLSTDADGIIWGNGSKVYRVDPATDKVTYWQPIDVTPGPRSWVARGATPGQPGPQTGPAYAYHAVRDAAGIVWYSVLETGGIVRLDPATGQQKYIQLPGVASVRGIDVDNDGVIWATDWTDGHLVRYDPVSGQSSLFSIPTEGAMPYSVFVDRKRGYIWTADYAGNNLVRLDPESGKFVEYPLPNNESYPRFISIDDDGRIWFAEWWNNRAGLLDPGY